MNCGKSSLKYDAIDCWYHSTNYETLENCTLHAALRLLPTIRIESMFCILKYMLHERRLVLARCLVDGIVMRGNLEEFILISAHPRCCRISTAWYRALPTFLVHMVAVNNALFPVTFINNFLRLYLFLPKIFIFLRFIFTFEIKLQNYCWKNFL